MPPPRTRRLGNHQRNSRLPRSLRHTLESLGLHLLLGLLGRLPTSWDSPLARILAALATRIVPQRRRVLEFNLRVAFPELDGAALRRLQRRITVQTILFALELARLHRAAPEEVIQAVPTPAEGQQYLDELLSGEKGFLIAGAHLGNWEWLAAWGALTVPRPLGVVYKPMHNAQTDMVAQDLRRRFGIIIFSTRERRPRALFEHLRAGGAVAILADQDARREGRFIPFFGKPASTNTGLASLAVRLDVPILPAFCLREGPSRFRVLLFPPLRPDPAADREAEELRLMSAYHHCLEEAIRRAPDQYFWWHRRWKTQPKD